MTPDLTIDTAAHLAAGLERRDQQRLGGSREEARTRVARRLGLLPGTLETLARKRLKRLEVWVFARIAHAAEAELREEIARHAHELEIACRCRRYADPGEVAAGLARLQAALASVSGGGRTTDEPAPLTETE